MSSKAYFKVVYSVPGGRIRFYTKTLASSFNTAFRFTTWAGPVTYFTEHHSSKSCKKPSMFSSPLNVGGLPTFTQCWGQCVEAMWDDGEGLGLLRDEGEEGGGETA